MKAIIIISLAVIALLLLLRRVSGYDQCWRSTCPTEQVQDVNGNLVDVPNMDCLRASSVAEYCTEHMSGTISDISKRDDPATCSDDPGWQNADARNAEFQKLRDEAAVQEAAFWAQREEEAAYQSANADSWGGSLAGIS
jgi:hypothetical protein